MAILQGSDGKFYEIDDTALKGKEVTGDKVPKEFLDDGEPPAEAAGGEGDVTGHRRHGGHGHGHEHEEWHNHWRNHHGHWGHGGR